MTWVPNGQVITGGGISTSPFAGSSETAALRKHTEGPVNVATYLPAGYVEGTTDATAAADAAESAAPTGGRVIFPPGTYIIKNWTISKALIVEGYGATFKLPALAAGDGSPIVNVTASGVTFRGITFDGNKSAHSADGFHDSWGGGTGTTDGYDGGLGRSYRAAIRYYSVGSVLSGSTVTDCYIHHAYGAAVAHKDVEDIKITHNRFEDNNFESVWAHTTLAHGSGQWRSRVLVSGNITLRAGSGHATINGNEGIISRYRQVEWTNNSSDTTERGLKFEGCADLVIANNVFRNVTVAGFEGVKVQFDGTNIVIANNTVDGAGKGIGVLWATPGSGFTNVTVSGNVIRNITDGGGGSGDGIQIAGLADYSGISILNNSISAVGRYGIYATTNGMTKLRISGNVVDTNSKAGVLFTPVAAWTDVDVGGNTIRAGGDGGIYLLASGAGAIDRMSVVGNTISATNNVTIAEANATVTSGWISGNTLAGSISAQAASGWRTGENRMTVGSYLNVSGLNRTVTTTPYTVIRQDTNILTNLATPGAVALTLPASPEGGRFYVIKDAKGDAGANNITITRGGTSLIDGATTKVIATNYGTARLFYDGTNWWSL